MSEGTALLLALGSAILAIVYGAVSVGWVLSKPAGNDRMQEIAAAIQEGAKAYMNRQYSTIAVVGVLLTIVLWLALDMATAIVELQKFETDYQTTLATAARVLQPSLIDFLR
mgnify:CR=1 FL=1